MEKNKSTHAELVRPLEPRNAKSSKGKVLVLLLVVVALGIGSGLIIAKGTTGKTTSSNEMTAGVAIEKGKTFGVNDSSTFKDVAEGTLKDGGIEGEGQYHLERPGGATQYVYLTSSVVDLGLVKGRKIKVWGQTQKAQHAPWLMDVGRVELLN